MTLFPNITTNPMDKDREWLLNYAKAVVDQQMKIPLSRFAGRGTKLNEIRDYARGKQPIEMYQKMLKISEDTSEDNWFSLDYTPVPFVNCSER